MKYLLLGVALLFTVPALAESRFDCQDLAGVWQGERFDQTLGAQTKTIASFSSNGYVYLEYRYNDGDTIFRRSLYGKWDCDGDIMTLATRSSPSDEFIDDYFEISELNSSYLAYRHVAAICENRLGDCGDIDYELVKIAEDNLEHEGC